MSVQQIIIPGKATCWLRAISELIGNHENIKAAWNFWHRVDFADELRDPAKGSATGRSPPEDRRPLIKRVTR